MSSRDNKNLLKADNHQLRYGENFAELMEGQIPPALHTDIEGHHPAVPYSQMDLRILDRAMELRRQATSPVEEYEDHNFYTGYKKSNHQDHILTFFERFIRRNRSTIEAHIQHKNEYFEEERRLKQMDLLQRSDRLSETEKFEFDVLTGLSMPDEVIAGEIQGLADSQVDVKNIFDLDETIEIAKIIVRHGLEQKALKEQEKEPVLKPAVLRIINLENRREDGTSPI